MKTIFFLDILKQLIQATVFDEYFDNYVGADELAYSSWTKGVKFRSLVIILFEVVSKAINNSIRVLCCEGVKDFYASFIRKNSRVLFLQYMHPPSLNKGHVRQFYLQKRNIRPTSIFCLFYPILWCLSSPWRHFCKGKRAILIKIRWVAFFHFHFSRLFFLLFNLVLDLKSSTFYQL